MPSQIELQFHISGPEFERDFVIPLGETMIGREPSSALPLVYPLVSRRHARLDCNETSCTITDLESANGTIVNGVRLNPNEPMPLADGMHITIGPFEISCSVVTEAKGEPSEPEQAGESGEAAAPEVPAQVEPEASAAQEAKGGEEQPGEAAAKKPPRPSRSRPAAEKPAAGSADEPPASPPEQPPEPPEELLPAVPDRLLPIPGLSMHSQRLINYLPGIYSTDFMSRFLGLFEAILVPIEWNVDNFDLYLDPGTSPVSFLPWLAGWYQIVYDSTWSESQRRTLLKEAHQIYARRGTRWSLCRLLEIYTGSLPDIIEFSDPKDPFTFIIKLPLRERDVNRQLLENLIDQNKPAHTSYVLEFRS